VQHMKQRILVFLLLLFWLSDLSAQKAFENNFVRYTTEDGMTHNAITGIVQDSVGFVWVATQYGLNRFDGSRFIQFHSTSDSLSLPSEDIWAINWLDKERLAVYPVGLHILNTKTGETRNLFIPYHDKQYQYKFNMIIRVSGDDNGNIYVLSRSGFYQFDKNGKLVFRFDYYPENQVPFTHFFFGEHMIELDDNRLMIISREALFIYNKGKKQLKKMTTADCPLMSEFLKFPSPPYLFFQQKAGSLFILNPENDSLTYVNTITKKKVVSHLPINPVKNEFRWRSRLIPISDTIFYITSHFSGFYKMRFYPETGAVKLYPEKYFSSYQCRSILKDKEDHLWIATNRGLLRQDSRRSLVQTASFPAAFRDSFPNILLDDIYVSGNRIYVATRGDAGLFVFNKKKFEFEKQIILDKEDRRNNTINAIVSTSPSTLLLGTNGQLFQFDQVNEKLRKLMPPKWDVVGDWTNDMGKDSKNNIWIGAGNIYRYDLSSRSFLVIPAHPKLLDMPNCIQEDKDGHIWIAGHGLARYNTELNKFDLLIDSFPFIKMPDKQVNSFVIDGQNTLWFGALNNGLSAYNIDQRGFRHFTTSDGLPNNNIASMIVIGSKLWIATFTGIACMDLRTLKISSFGKEDGFPDMPIVRNAKFFYDSSAQQLYLAFANAITRFNPFEILQKRQPPKVFIENVVAGEKDFFLPGPGITTSWRNNEIMITTGSINFSDGGGQRFAYRILKGNTEVPWQQLGVQSAFSISNLSPGTYRIQVKCFSINNSWQDQVKELSLIVLPPFWKTDWFRLLTGGVLLVLIYLLFRWRMEQVRKKEMAKTQIEKLKADDYKNQFELEQISNYFSSSLVGKNTVEEVLWDVTHNLIGRMNYEDCMIYLWNEDKTKMVQKAAYGPKGHPEFISAQIFEVLPGQGVVGHAIQTRQPVLVKDTRMDDRYRVDDAFRLSEVCVPIIHNDELLGILDSEHHLSNYFSERDIKMLTTIATLLGNKLKQIEADQSLQAKREELANINEQLAEARLAALQAQMNPHFVFNALNSIKRMILDGDNEKASRYLSKFAQMIRMTLNHSKDVFIMLDENIEYLKAYLEMEQLRFDDSFNYSICKSENIDVAETPIPSMMIQPLVENAIWHGLMASKTEKKLLIGFTQLENKIICTVEDNGIGISQSQKSKDKNDNAHHSIGLENLQKRIKIMNEKYDMGCSLQITDLNGTGKNRSGTKVTLEFNLINV
jgi:putative methionine-R-sulfoxide reductase with GAF domain